jgi:hypothetical protein
MTSFLGHAKELSIYSGEPENSKNEETQIEKIKILSDIIYKLYVILINVAC